jgi:hypothetical protein
MLPSTPIDCSLAKSPDQALPYKNERTARDWLPEASVVKMAASVQWRSSEHRNVSLRINSSAKIDTADDADAPSRTVPRRTNSFTILGGVPIAIETTGKSLDRDILAQYPVPSFTHRGMEMDRSERAIVPAKMATRQASTKQEAVSVPALVFARRVFRLRCDDVDTFRYG